jgi:hypothetical protein
MQGNVANKVPFDLSDPRAERVCPFDEGQEVTARNLHRVTINDVHLAGQLSTG